MWQFQIVDDVWPYDREDVVWLNEWPGAHELAVAFMTYGNQAELDWKYSYAALIINVPPYAERSQKL